MSPSSDPLAALAGADGRAEAVFDRAVLLDRARGDAAVMQRILRSFVDEADASVRAIQAAQRRGNLRFAREFAYTLRVAAANAGACAVAQTAARVEREVGPPPSHGLAATLAQLAAHLAEFRSAAAAELGA
jgi:HPt (histidine-containing phosphotransfer) domain-containing protein